MHDSATCPVCSGAALGGSMSDEEFFSFLTACRQDLAGKQSRFAERIQTEARWHYDMATLRLTFGNRLFQFTPIGTFSPQHRTWLWAWANEDFPLGAREAARKLQDLHAVTGFRVFLDPGIAASAADADDFVAMALHLLDAEGFFRVPSSGPTLFLAVFSEIF